MRRLLLACVVTVTLGGVAAAQRAAPPPADSTLLTVDRIYASPEFRGGSLGPLAWLSDGSAYTTLETSPGTDDARDIVRYDAQTGARTILVPASRLVPAGESAPLDIGEAQTPPTEALLEHSVFFPQILDHVHLMAIDPASEHHQQRAKRQEK